jgi:hypothetical protein
MGARHPNHRLVKLYRTYSVEELATLFKVHPNTVRAWRQAGLTTIDEVKPMLFLGAHVAIFLRQRKLSGKRPCKPGQIYCLPCRAPKIPALGIADFGAFQRNDGRPPGSLPRLQLANASPGGPSTIGRDRRLFRGRRSNAGLRIRD